MRSQKRSVDVFQPMENAMENQRELRQLGAELPEAIVDEFCNQVDKRGFKKKKALQGAVELWISMQGEIQSYIISRDSGNVAFEDVIKFIVRDRMRELRGLLKSQTENRPEASQPQTQD